MAATATTPLSNPAGKSSFCFKLLSALTNPCSCVPPSTARPSSWHQPSAAATPSPGRVRACCRARRPRRRDTSSREDRCGCPAGATRSRPAGPWSRPRTAPGPTRGPTAPRPRVPPSSYCGGSHTASLRTCGSRSALPRRMRESCSRTTTVPDFQEGRLMAMERTPNGVRHDIFVADSPPPGEGHNP